MPTLRHFPRGACGDISLLLGTFLTLQGFGQFRYLCGHLTEGTKFESHAWILGHGLIVDITADQFGDEMPSVFVGASTEWYERWKDVSDLGAADFRQWNEQVPGELARSFAAITESL
jgi:hypothetical protein